MIFLFLEMLALGFSSELYCEGPPPKTTLKEDVAWRAIAPARGKRVGCGLFSTIVPKTKL